MSQGSTIMQAVREVPDFAARYANLANARLGAAVVSVTDEFFGARDRLIRTEEPSFDPDLYDDHGKYMDGWESRRRRDGGNDRAIIRLGGATIVRAVNIDTAFFTGNFPHAASLQGAFHTGEGLPADSDYRPLVGMSRLGPDAAHWFDVAGDQPVDDRQRIGARNAVFVHGRDVEERRLVADGEILELGGVEHGGRDMAGPVHPGFGAAQVFEARVERPRNQAHRHGFPGAASHAGTPSARSFRAALRPGDPVTSPPGWAEAPQR